MLTDAELRSELQAALEAVTPPAPWLSDSIEKEWRATHRSGRGRGVVLGFRISLRVAALALLIGLALSSVAVFLASHHSTIPASPITGPVIFPTHMVSSTTGWAVTQHGYSQQWWRTSDGASTWIDVTPPDLSAGSGFASFSYFLDASHAWITQTAGFGTATPTVVTYRTLDGGKSWQRGVPVPIQGSVMTVEEDFIDPNLGWMTLPSDLPQPSLPDVFATVDGGLHWSKAASQVDPLISAPGLLVGSAQPSFLSPSMGWLSVGLYTPHGSSGFFFSRTTVLVTKDGGRTWKRQPLPVEPSEGDLVDSPVFFGQRQGNMLMHPIDPTSSAKSVLFATSDGGLTWSARPLHWAYIWSAQFVDEQHGWAVAGPGSDFMKVSGGETIPLPLYRTSDGGITWTQVVTNLNLQTGRDRVTDLHFVDQETGFATVWNDSGPTELLRSVDGGRTWNVAGRCNSALGLLYPPPVCPVA